MGRGIIQTNVEKLGATLRGISKLSKEYKETKKIYTPIKLPLVSHPLGLPQVTVAKIEDTRASEKAKQVSKKVFGAGARALMGEYVRELPQEKRAQQVVTLAKRGGASTELLDKFKKDLTSENLQEIYNIQQYYTIEMRERQEDIQQQQGGTGFPELGNGFLSNIDWKLVLLGALGLGALYVVSKGGSKR